MGHISGGAKRGFYTAFNFAGVRTREHTHMFVLKRRTPFIAIPDCRVSRMLCGLSLSEHWRKVGNELRKTQKEFGQTVNGQ